MKHLIKFSIDRRLKNKITIIMHILILVILFGGFFADKIIEIFFETNNLKTVYYDDSAAYLIEYISESDYFEFKAGASKDSINLSNPDKWVISSEYSLTSLESITLSNLISEAVLNHWLYNIHSESLAYVLPNISPQIEFKTVNDYTIGQDKINISMFIITGIYFAMLSFSTMIANEVVYEKTSRVLELILTSVSTTTHYFSKMIIAWLTVIIQISIFLFEFIFTLAIRNMYDEGLGLLRLFSKHNIIEVNALTFKQFVIDLDINANLVFVLVVSLIYLMLGMVIIQMIIVSLSSFVKSIEESSLLAAPVYIVLLLIYYLALALNNPLKLSSGLGYNLSFTPIFSMLFMPMRLLLLSVSIYEILLGIILNVCFLVITSFVGAYIYNIGILGGVNIKSLKK